MRKILTLGLILLFAYMGFAFGEPIKYDKVGCTPMSASQNHLRPQSINTNIVYVKKNQTIQAVIDSITDESSYNQYVIKVPPGHEDDTYTDTDWITVEFQKEPAIQLTHLDTIANTTAMRSMTTHNDYLIVAAATSGVNIYDISDPTSLSLVKNIDTAPSGYETYWVECAGNYCVVGTRQASPKAGRIDIIDCSNADATNWTLSDADGLAFNDFRPTTLKLKGVPNNAGAYAFVGANISPGGFMSIDLSDASAISIADTVVHTTDCEPHGMAYSSAIPNHAFAGNYSNSQKELVVIDVTDPTNCSVAANLDLSTSNYAWGAAIKDTDILYVALCGPATTGPGIATIEISTPDSPALVSTEIIPESMRDSAAAFDRPPTEVFIVDSVILANNGDQGFAVFDGTDDPWAPVYVGNILGGVTPEIMRACCRKSNLLFFSDGPEGDPNDRNVYVYRFKTRCKTSKWTMTGNETFNCDDGPIFVVDPGGANRTLNPSGQFPPMQITVINTADAAETITFDSSGVNQAIAQNERAIFVYDGAGGWIKVYVGS